MQEMSKCKAGFAFFLLVVGLGYTQSAAPLHFLSLGTTPGVTRVILPPQLDGFSSAINITGQFPFGHANETVVYVDTNGYFLFRRGLRRYIPEDFPSSQLNYVVAPFWADNDARVEGQVSYEVHTSGSSRLNQVNTFISSYEGVQFTGTWMIVAEWYQMRPYPHITAGGPNPRNTYQGILVTNGTRSYAVFIYKCGLMGWSGSASIGYYAEGSIFQNHPQANSSTARTIACRNFPTSVWSNVIYQLGVDPLPAYLQFLPLGTTSGVTKQMLDQEDDHYSSPINIPGGFQFANSTETVVHVDTNGYFLFRRGFSSFTPSAFPGSLTHIVAPFWADNDIRAEGEISYEVHTSGSPLLSQVNSFIDTYDGVVFAGTWMVVAEWKEVQQFPHVTVDSTSPRNTYQGVLVTDGAISYTVFTYKCGLMGWSGSASIGYYAEGTFFQNHPQANSNTANTTSCANSPTSAWSNVVYRLSIIYEVPQVIIVTDPPTPPYPVATWIRLRCDVVTSLSVSYNWTGYCTSQGSNQTVFTYTNLNTTGAFTLRVRSTPSACRDTVVCSAVDSMGNTGEAVWQITNVTGAGLWGASQPISNNSALIADSSGQIGTIFCHSASQQSNIGRWISQAGNDITFTSTDAFAIGLRSGGFPSYTTLTLSSGFELMAADQGVYSCQIPDENGTQNTFHIGIYTNGYGGRLHITTVQRVPLPSLVINCSTTGLPATSVVWTKENTQLMNSETYQLIQLLIDRSTSTYTNLLTINRTLQEARGIYACTAVNEQIDTTLSGTSPNVTTVKHFFAMYIVGDTESIRCTISGATRVEWLQNGTIVLSGTGNQLVLQLSITDSIHHSLYTCRGYSSSSALQDLNISTIVNVPDTAISISTSPSETPTLGQNHRIRCIVSETVGGLSTRPVPQWRNHDGSELITGSGIILDGPSYESTVAMLTLMFNALRTSHAGRYICQATLSSPALVSPLVKMEDYNISVQIPTPTVTLFSPTGTTPYADSSFTLHCTIHLNQLIDSPVAVSVTWRKLGVLISNSSRITVYDVSQSSSHTYLSMAVFSTLSMTLDSGEYSCEASLSASPPSPYITGSLSATSAYSLTVELPTIEVQFNQSMYTVSEAVGSLSVCIQLVGGDLSQQVDVAIQSLDGTATAPSDYSTVAVTLMFPSGSSSTPNPPQQCTTIVIANDRIPEDQDDYFNLLASSSDPSVFFTPGRNNVSVLIEDDDSPILHVTVASNTTTYQVASSATLTCHVEPEAVQPVSYQWSSTCSGQCSMAGQTVASVTISLLRSIDSGTHTCTVTDNVGNSGNGSVQFNVTGVGLYYIQGLSSGGPATNNSIIRSGNDGSFGTLLCLSGSRVANVGSWITPHGQDITLSTTDIFTVTVGGQDNPGYMNISLEAGQSLGISQQGVYTCIIPDEREVQHTLHVGIYPPTFSAPVSVTSLERAAMEYSPNFALNCTSTGSPATTVTWSRDGTQLSSGSVYEMAQILRDGAAATYDNILVVMGTPSTLLGVYSCTVRNEIGESTMSTTISGLHVRQEILIVGETATLTCSSDLDVTMTEWLYSGTVAVTSTDPQAELVFSPVRDSFHNRHYICRVTSPYGVQEQTVIIFVEVGPGDFMVSISTSNMPILAGQMFNLTCTVTTVDGLQNVPTVEWLDASGNQVTTGGDITVGNAVTMGTATTLALRFSPLRVSHGGEFTCRVALTSPAPPQHLTKAAVWDLIVDRPSVEITIQPHTIISYVTAPYNTFTLNCTAIVHDTIIVPKTFHWRMFFGGQESEISSDRERFVITDMNLNVPTSSSILRVTENTPGTYQYACFAVLQFPGEEDDIISSGSANVTVQAAQIPAQPANVTVTNVSSSSATMQWTVALITYTPEEYVIHYGLSQDMLNLTSTTLHGNLDVSVVYETHSLVVNDLLPETTYYFRVVSRNGFGSERSGIKTFTTLPKQQAPSGPPLNLVVNSITSMALTLSWELPALVHRNGAILNYTLTCTPPAGSDLPSSSSVFTTANTHTLNSLTPATLYSCSVFATNLYGNSPPANVTVMTADGVPGPVAGITYQTVSDTQIIITWREPEMTNGLVLHYHINVTSYSTGQTVYTKVVPVGGELSDSVTGLAPFIPYKVFISAENSNPVIGEVKSIDAFSREGSPTAPPRNVMTDRLNGTHMLISWELPTLVESRGFIVSITITYTPIMESVRKRKRQVFTFQVLGNSTSAVIGGLNPDLQYSVTVSTSTIGGTGPETAAVVSTPCTKFFQLLLSEVNDCNDWRFENTREKLADITNSIITAVNARCQCSLTANHISTGHFLCTTDPQVVLYRAELSGRPDCARVLSYIDGWVSEGPSILVQSNSIAVEATCQIEVESLTAQVDCVSPTAPALNNEGGFGLIGAVAGGIGGVIVIGIIVLGAVVVCMCARLKKRRAVHMDSNQAYGIPDRPNQQNPYFYNETYQMIPINCPPISPPLPSHTGNLGLSPLHRSESNASYVKMNAAAQEKCDELYEKVGPKEEAIYEKVGPSQWPNNYADPSGRQMYANM